jgi:hypothetical protein
MAITGISAISGEQIIAAGAVSAREAASAAFTTGGNSLQGLYDTVSNNSGSWTGGSTYTGDAQGALDEVYSNSANWNSTYTTVSSNSATWGQGGGGSDGIVVIDTTLGSYDPQEIYNTINSSWGLKSIYAKVNSTPTTYGPDRTLYLPVNIRYPYDDGASQSGYLYEGHYQFYVDGQYALNGQSFQVGYDSINDNYTISEPQINPDMPVPIAWPSDDGRVLTVRDDGGIEWRTPQGGALPQSASDAIDVVTGGSANWNGTTETVSSNSASWGGSALPISAGPGIKLEMVNDTLVASTDETLLWSGARTSAIQTIESMKNFDKCQVYIAHGTYGPPQVYTIDFADMGTTGYFAITRPRGSSNLNIACIRLTADDTHLAAVNAKCLSFGSWSTTATGMTATTGEAEDLNSIIKVVGINRIAGV